jgi:hypothetical protein
MPWSSFRAELAGGDVKLADAGLTALATVTAVCLDAEPAPAGPTAVKVKV